MNVEVARKDYLPFWERFSFCGIYAFLSMESHINFCWYLPSNLMLKLSRLESIISLKVSITLLECQQQKLLYYNKPRQQQRHALLCCKRNLIPMENCVETQYGNRLQIHTNITSENKLNEKTIYHGTKTEKGKMLKAMNCRIGYKQQPEPSPTDTKRTLRFPHWR